MKQFPKKHKPQDLRNRAKLYREGTALKDSQDKKIIFSKKNLPIYKKFVYNDFFDLYMNDFFNRKNALQSKLNEDSDLFESLFVLFDDGLENICSDYTFFQRKNQTLSQVGVNKLSRRNASLTKKAFNTNSKIIDSYFSSPYKISIPDSNTYNYILHHFQSLREKGKITHETNIGYRSFNLQTFIAPQDITRKDEEVPYYTLKYFIGAKCEALPVCITGDIDVCCGDVALLVHPKDKRYNKHIGKTAIIPLCNRQIPIIGDENVNISIDNGIKRVCPCSDQESIEIAKKYGLPTDIYVFNPQGLYTDFIHESAFVGQERKKYYENIEGFIEDIGNLAEKRLINKKVPYLDKINERLTPYKVDQFAVNLQEEKHEIIKKIFNRELSFSFLDQEFGNSFNEINFIENKISTIQSNNTTENFESEDSSIENQIEILQNQVSELKQPIIAELNKYLPDKYICNNQLPFNRKIPVLKDKNGEFSFFDIKKYIDLGSKKRQQIYFDYILLSLVRIGVLGIKKFGSENSENSKFKLCEYEKIFSILSQNEKKIQIFIDNFETVGKKEEQEDFIKIIQNLTDEFNSSINECAKLVENSSLLQEEGDWLYLNVSGISNEFFDSKFIQLISSCYLHDNNIAFSNKIVYNHNERLNIFLEILIQQLFLGDSISHNFMEYSYNKNDEFLGDKQLSKNQIEQSQRDFFTTYGENPIRLNFLVNGTYDQKQILLNNIFLKQIRNAARLCLQKGFFPKEIKSYIQNPPSDFDDFDLSAVEKLNGLYEEWKQIKNFDQYIHFFEIFKTTSQDLFFARYLEIQKAKPTKNVKFICTYFFNFLLTILYPLIPEFVDALCYISAKDFIVPFSSISTNRATNYNMNLLYDTFIKIKNIKIELNIKQHEYCKLFIKSSPTLGQIFEQNEQIFKNYFHISEIMYTRLHEQNPLGYDIFSIESDESILIGVQAENSNKESGNRSPESLEKELKNLEDKLSLIRQRLQILPEGEQRSKAEEEFAKTKEEMENLTIKYSLLSSK